jgi:hypothetical protein
LRLLPEKISPLSNKTAGQYRRQTTLPFWEISSIPLKFAGLPSAPKVYFHSPFER